MNSFVGFYLIYSILFTTVVSMIYIDVMVYINRQDYQLLIEIVTIAIASTNTNATSST